MTHEIGLFSKKIHTESILLPLWKGAKQTHSLFFSFLVPEEKTYLSLVLKHAKGEEGSFEKAVMPKSGRIIFICGLGEKEQWSLRKLNMFARTFIGKIKKTPCASLGVCMEDLRVKGLSLERVAELFVINAEMGAYEFLAYKEKPKEKPAALEHITYLLRDATKTKSMRRAIEVGFIIGTATSTVRDFANTPASDMTPKHLAREAEKLGKQYGFSVKALGEAEMKKLKMGSILAVSKGSAQEAQLIVMEYFGGPKSQKPLVFIGKGVTFDTGGINLKPSGSIGDMHMDMSGGAAVLGALTALARMKAPVSVVGIIPAVENMPSGSSYLPSDVVTSMSGKTIEIGNTDAEGRVIMADAFTYSERYQPSMVVDVATLTGACMVALGDYAFAVLSPSEELAHKVKELGEFCGDYCWPLPLWEEYEQDIKGDVGDILNAAKNHPRGGAINAAVFLHQFAKNFSAWVHCDIASTMTNYPSSHLSSGASGTGTRLLVEIARAAKEKKFI